MLSLLSAREALTVARIVKVNHAGEHGAIRIYGGQIVVAGWFYPDLVATLAKLRDHEIEHRALFLAAMPKRMARPCRIMNLWALGGSELGTITALMGRQAIWVTTAAVEAAVHHHLDDQLHFLNARDQELHMIIADIREEELSHLNLAKAHMTHMTMPMNALSILITFCTDALIWLSTWGDSARLARDLRASKTSQ